MSSFTVGQCDMLDSVNRIIGRTDADWDITSVPSADMYAAGIERMNKGDMAGFGMAICARLSTRRAAAISPSNVGWQTRCSDCRRRT